MFSYYIQASCVHSNPLQEAFMMGSFEVHWYAITYLCGFLVAIIIGCLKLHYYYRVSYEPFFWYAIMAIPGAIFGARSWSYIIGDAKITAPNAWGGFLQFFGGDGAGGIAGLAILGGVIFDVIIALIWFPLILKKGKYTVRVRNSFGLEAVKRPSVWIYADAIVPLIVLGQAIGRWGNFTNHEVFGDIANPQTLSYLLFVMPHVFNNMLIIPQQWQYNIVPEIGNFYEPFFLYESFGDIMLWFFLYFGLERIRWIKRGSLAASYFIGYGIIRSSMETLRYGFNFADFHHTQFKPIYNGYGLMKFGFTKDYITACVFIIFGVLAFVFVNLYAFNMRKYEVWRSIRQKIAFPFVYFYYKIQQWSFSNYSDPKKHKHSKLKNSSYKIKLSEIEQKLQTTRLYKNPISAYSRIKDLKYYYADYDEKN